MNTILKSGILCDSRSFHIRPWLEIESATHWVERPELYLNFGKKIMALGESPMQSMMWVKYVSVLFATLHNFRKLLHGAPHLVRKNKKFIKS